MDDSRQQDGGVGVYDDHTIRDYCEMMDEVMPHLRPAEQIVYQRLFRLSHVRDSEFTKCRYEDLARQCGLSLRTFQRAVKGLRQKKLLKTLWQSHGATTFSVHVLSGLQHRPAFLPRQVRRDPLVSPLPRPARPPVYNAFTPEDRDLFITCKRSLSPLRLNEITEVAVDWLTERAGGDPEHFSDDLLRDKVDELVFREVFGAERRERYEHLFSHLYNPL
jgi:hypothetical protein